MSDALDDWTDELPASFMLCRDFGHNWAAWRALPLPDKTGYRRVLRCSRCHSERHQDITMSGRIMGGSYTYPEGYLAPTGSGALTGAHREHLRVTSTLRMIQKGKLKVVREADSAPARKQARRGA